MIIISHITGRASAHCSCSGVSNKGLDVDDRVPRIQRIDDRSAKFNLHRIIEMEVL